MVDILMAFLVLSFVACCGILLALLREHSHNIVYVFGNVIEAMQTIKTEKARRTIRGS